MRLILSNLLRLRSRGETLPEINTWTTLVEVSLINASDSATREEDSDERRVVAAWPVFDRKDKRVCVVIWRIWELEVTVKWHLKSKGLFSFSGFIEQATHPCVVETETEERQLEIEVLMNLLVRCVNVFLQISSVRCTTALIKEPVHELTSDLS